MRDVREVDFFLEPSTVNTCLRGAGVAGSLLPSDPASFLVACARRYRQRHRRHTLSEPPTPLPPSPRPLSSSLPPSLSHTHTPSPPREHYFLTVHKKFFFQVDISIGRSFLRTFHVFQFSMFFLFFLSFVSKSFVRPLGRNINFTNWKTLVGRSASRPTVLRVTFDLPQLQRTFFEETQVKKKKSKKKKITKK